MPASADRWSYKIKEIGASLLVQVYLKTTVEGHKLQQTSGKTGIWTSP